MDIDKPDTRFHQSPGQQQALSQFVSAVALSEGGHLAGKIEGLPHLRRMQELQRPLLIHRHRARLPASLGIDQRQQGLAVFESGQGEVGRQLQLIGQVREHLADVHDDTGKSDDQLREFVSANAYDATDA